MIIPEKTFLIIKELHTKQKDIPQEHMNDYGKGFYDALELTIASIENREPVLTQIEIDGRLM